MACRNEDITNPSEVDTPSVSNADVSVADGWTISPAALAAGNVATFSGALSFDSGATFELTDPEDTSVHGCVVARAASVTGLPTNGSGNWVLTLDADGKTVRLRRGGTLVIIVK